MAASITLQIFSYLVNFLYFFIPRFVSSSRKKIFLLSNNFSSLVRFFFFFFIFFILLLRSISTSCYPSCQKYVSRFEEINYDMTHLEEGETTRMIFNRKGNSLDGSLNNFKLRRKLK